MKRPLFVTAILLVVTAVGAGAQEPDRISGCRLVSFSRVGPAAAELAAWHMLGPFSMDFVVDEDPSLMNFLVDGNHSVFASRVGLGLGHREAQGSPIARAHLLGDDVVARWSMPRYHVELSLRPEGDGLGGVGTFTMGEAVYRFDARVMPCSNRV
jgi:hypothetical protein